MKFKYGNIIILFLLIIVFHACEKKNCLSSAGKTVSEERDLQVFKYVEIYDNFKIYLQNDTAHKVRIATGEKLIPYIETYVQNDTLIIKDNNTCNFLKNYPEKEIYISVDTLKSMDVYGPSDVFSIDTFKVHSCKIRFLADVASCDLTIDAYVFQLQIWYSSGDFRVKGKTYASYLDAEATSFIYADSLTNTICHASNNSKGDIYLQSGERFYYKLKNTGNIYYSGQPDTIIIQEHSGKGLLIKQ
jgi:hypothetical protein